MRAPHNVPALFGDGESTPFKRPEMLLLQAANQDLPEHYFYLSAFLDVKLQLC